MSQTPPGSMGAPFLGEALAFLKDPFTFTMSRTKQHGNVWKTRILGDTVVFFAGPKSFSFFMNPENFTRQSGSPKFLQDIMHKDAVPFIDGDRHRKRKRLLLAAFSDTAIASYMPGVFTVFQRYAEKWAGKEQAVAGDLSQLSFDIADHLFAANDPSASNAEIARDFATVNKGAFSTPINLPWTAYGKALKARDRLRKYLKAQIAAKDGAGTALGVLKQARSPEGEALSTAELEIELLHFYFAACAGIAATIAWTFVVLGQYPELAKRLREEADRVLGDGAPTLAQIRELAGARAVSREVLRSFPITPTTFIGVARRDLEHEGFAIKAGWKGAGAIWATLQDGTTFKDPTAFRGTRLLDPAFAALPDNAFVPQGGGPAEGHRCPGDTLMQALMPGFLGWFVKHYDLKLPAQDTSPASGGIGPLPKSGVRVAIARRA